MSGSSTSPDAPRTVSGTAFGRPYVHTEPVPPPVGHDVAAGVLTVVVTVLLGAPVGLLWAALAPRVPVVVSGTGVEVLGDHRDRFIAGDASYLAAVVIAGVVGGLLAWRFAAAHGPAVVLGLAAGGIVAAYVAMVVGEQVGSTARELVDAGASGRAELALQLRSTPALVGWPVASLLGYLGASFSRGR